MSAHRSHQPSSSSILRCMSLRSVPSISRSRALTPDTTLHRTPLRYPTCKLLCRAPFHAKTRQCICCSLCSARSRCPTSGRPPMRLRTRGQLRTSLLRVPLAYPQQSRRRISRLGNSSPKRAGFRAARHSRTPGVQAGTPQRECAR